MGDGGGCGLCRCVNLLITLAFLGVGGYLAWHFLGRPSADDLKQGAQDLFGGNWTDFDNFDDVLDGLKDFSLGDFAGGDPFLANNGTQSWPNYGKGLLLTVQNALNDDWHSEFELAVSDWDNGDPDALTLTIENAAVDNACSQVDGLLKVCNGNFGETGWLGINEILSSTKDKIIQSSVAKMNEYYLRNAGNAERQYTMCHEIGHGFGLPHTDESFTNPSLENCLDYTNWPEDNMHPDVTNYRRLVSLYGRVEANRMRRSLRSNHRRLTPALRQEYEQAIWELEHPTQIDMGTTRWRKLREHGRGTHLVRRLGEDYLLEVHMLYPLN